MLLLNLNLHVYVERQYKLMCYKCITLCVPFISYSNGSVMAAGSSIEFRNMTKSTFKLLVFIADLSVFIAPAIITESSIHLATGCS